MALATRLYRSSRVSQSVLDASRYLVICGIKPLGEHVEALSCCIAAVSDQTVWYKQLVSETATPCRSQSRVDSLASCYPSVNSGSTISKPPS